LLFADTTLISAKSNSITVKWGKNASADGYKVVIYKGGKWVKKTLKGSTNATVTIGGLRAGSVYKVGLRLIMVQIQALILMRM
ncbi:fibronectin type III domain-containing protein, partial [[Eubacterium] siraeum]|nr:fibronectin type III domain-containing protein [[Eubacterium] siraeum]